MTRTLAVVYHSASGRTKLLAEAVGRGARAVDATDVHVFSVEEARASHDVLARAHAIVFGCPTYMGSVSAGLKAFMDASSGIWALQGWRDKLAAGFTGSAAPSGDKLGTLTQLAVFAAQHGMIWVPLGLPPTYVGSESAPDALNRLGSHLGAMAQSRPGGGPPPASDLATCEHLGKRVATLAHRLQLEAPKVAADRHPTTVNWQFFDARVPLPIPLERINLRDVVSRPDRFEHHLLVAATIDDVQLEVVTASEPLYFSHVNLSDEYAIALPTGDDLVDRFPLRTFLTDATTHTDVGRYNHRNGDLVLHPQGFLHWPGRLRAPYEPFDFPPGMRRTGLSLVYCANKPDAGRDRVVVRVPEGREADVKAYGAPAPPMSIADTDSVDGTVARIGHTTLTLVVSPKTIAPAHGAWVVVLACDGEGVHAPCDLVRIPEGASLDATGILRALVLTSDRAQPDAPTRLWEELPPPPFAPFEDELSGTLPFERTGLEVREVTPTTVAITIGEASAVVPRYWLARMLFRVALHGIALGYVETYEGFFVDDRDVREVKLGVRTATERATISVARSKAMGFIEALYRAVAPPGYRERI